MKSGIELIAIERQEQITKHGYSPMNDDDYFDFQLQIAAEAVIEANDGDFPAGWDLVKIQKMCDKPKKDRLVIAGAFYIAEIDRVQRRLNAVSAEIDRLNQGTEPELNEVKNK